MKYLIEMNNGNYEIFIIDSRGIKRPLRDYFIIHDGGSLEIPING